MNPNSQARPSSKSRRPEFANYLSFILAMTMVICVYSITMHFIEKWDGHFRDTRGCTSLQNSNGKLFKVDSCNGDIVPVEIPTEDFQRGGALPQLNAPLPPVQTRPGLPQTPQVPGKKLVPPKDQNAPKISPYMI